MNDIFEKNSVTLILLKIFDIYLCHYFATNKKQAISARERALCQLTVCFEFQSRSDRRKNTKVVPWKWCLEED